MQSWVFPLSRRLRVPIAGRAFREYASKSVTDATEPGSQRNDDQDVTSLIFPDIEVGDAGSQDGGFGNDSHAVSTHGEEEAVESDLKPDDIHPPFAQAFIKVDRDVRTHRFRKHGNKPLPLSPVIDPVFVAARNRWKMKKALPPKQEELTPFQKKLHNNPYAQALATSVRETQSTNVHLPRFFLLPLDLRRAPKPPYNPTWVPSRFWAESSINPVGDLQMSGPQSYVDLSRAVLDKLSRQPARAKDSIATYAHHLHFTSNTRRELRVRDGLSDFVLDLLQQGAMKSLAWLFKHPRTGIIERCDEGAYAIRGKADVACVLYTGPMYGSHVEDLARRVAREVQEADILGRRARGVQIFQHSRLPRDDKTPFVSNLAPILNPAAVYLPFEYPVARGQKDRAVPVYSLTDLLGEGRTTELLEGTKFQDARCVVVTEDGRGVKAQLALLKLQNFLSMGHSVGDLKTKRNDSAGRAPA